MKSEKSYLLIILNKKDRTAFIMLLLKYSTTASISLFVFNRTKAKVESLKAAITVTIKMMPVCDFVVNSYIYSIFHKS